MKNIVNRIPRWAQAVIVLIALGIGVLIALGSEPADVLEPTDETVVSADVLEPAVTTTTVLDTSAGDAAVAALKAADEDAAAAADCAFYDDFAQDVIEDSMRLGMETAAMGEAEALEALVALMTEALATAEQGEAEGCVSAYEVESLREGLAALRAAVHEQTAAGMTLPPEEDAAAVSESCCDKCKHLCDEVGCGSAECSACHFGCFVDEDVPGNATCSPCAAAPPEAGYETGYEGTQGAQGGFPPPSQTIAFIENTLMPNLADLGALTDPDPDNPDFAAVVAWLDHAKQMLADARSDDWAAVRTSALAMTETWIPARPSQSQWQQYRQKAYCNLGAVLANTGNHTAAAAA